LGKSSSDFDINYLPNVACSAVEWQQALDVDSQPIDVRLSENSFGFASPYWNAAALSDGIYQIRYFSQCSASAGDVPPGTDGSTSAIITGRIDRTAPSVFGLIEPTDQQFFLGDEVSFTFDEELRCSKPYRFQVNLKVEGISQVVHSRVCFLFLTVIRFLTTVTCSLSALVAKLPSTLLVL